MASLVASALTSRAVWAQVPAAARTEGAADEAGSADGARATRAAVAPDSAPPELLDSSIRLHREHGLSPFRSIDYAVVVRAHTPVAYQTKELVAYDDELQRMALLTWGEYAALWAALPDGLGSADVPASGADGRGAVWTLELRRAGATRVYRWHGELFELPEPVRIAVGAIRSSVVLHTGEIPFRNVFIDAGERGWVDIQSVPSARVFIDGRDTGEKTPLNTYEVAAGDHRLRLVNEERGVDESFDFKIQPGVTTVLDLDLR